jgi:hypothetical protein
MKHGIVIFCAAIFLALATSSASASAFSLFGFTISAAPQSQNTVSDSNAKSAVNTFLSDAEQEINNSCHQYSNHQYEVCFAYIYNSSLTDLVPYYKYVHSSSNSLARYVSYRLGSRYVGLANQTIASRVAYWPPGNFEVSTPSIRILAVHANLAANTATLHTMETWKVTTQAGRVVYTETDTPHTINMKRVPSYVLHKWVVTEIY